jgi:hypothetical protein
MSALTRWLKDRRAARRVKAAQRALQEREAGLPRRGAGAPRRDAQEKAGPWGGGP